MSIRKIRLPNGEIRWGVRLKSCSLGGKRINRRFLKESEARAFLDELGRQDRNLESNGFVRFDLDELTFKSEVDFWLQTKSHEFSPAYLLRVKLSLNKYLLPRFAHLKPMQFHFGLLQRIRSEMSDGSISPATVNRNMSVVKAVLNHSYLSRRIPSNPTQGFKPLREVRGHMAFWNREEAEKFLAFADKKYPKGTKVRWIYLAYLIALNSGLRASEIFGLRSEDFADSLIVVRGQFDKVARIYRPCKDKDVRSSPCPPELHREVSEWIRFKGLKSSDWLFQSDRLPEKPFDYDTFKQKKFDRDVATSGVRKIRFHDLRHTAATLMISENADVRTVQGILGHSSLATTELYAHSNEERVRKLSGVYRVIPRAPSTQV